MFKQYPTLKNLLLLPVLIMGVTARSQDLPTPSADLRTLPAGSYIIAMDNTNQQNSSGLFNLKAYGLAVYLLNNQVKLKWIISTGKTKDGIDFSVSSTQLRPTQNLTVASRDFKAGPLVILSSDTTGLAAMIDGFYAANSLTGNNRPNVFVSTGPVTVDQRYDLSGFKPTAAVLSDGGNQAIHLAFMTAASIPASNYTVVSGLNLLSNCYTFASEPHNDKTGTNVNTAINNIHMFVASGGNFLAECAAVPNYENNALGSFQTTTGITVTNTKVGTTVLFPNPDLSYSQFEGAFNGSLTGSVENWQINASGNNSEHNHVTGSGANTSAIAASVSKLVSGRGGLAFYLGNHNYSASDQQNINGIRMYMNAFLTPAYQVCPTVLPVRFVSFEGHMQGEKYQLSWSVAHEEFGSSFVVEKSTDGKQFFTLATMQEKAQTLSYTCTDTKLPAIAYYRVRLIHPGGGCSLSTTISVKPAVPAPEVSLAIGNGVLAIYYTSPNNEAISLNIYSASGQKFFSRPYTVWPGTNLLPAGATNTCAHGLYILQICSTSAVLTKKFLY